MGKTNGAVRPVNFFKTTIGTFAILTATCAFGQLPGSGGDFLNVAARGVKIPLYNKGELRFMLRAEQFEQHGKQLFANGAIIDIIRKNANVDDLRLGKNTIYRINAPVYEVVSFWGDRSGSDGVISSPQAKVDSVRRTAEGDDVVQVRTPMMDIDGVGFTANYETRQVTIPQNVHIVLRFGGRALNEAIEKNLPDTVRGNEKTARFADVWADSMFIDFDAKKVTLDGNIRFEESGALISCDKVVLHLGSDDKDSSKNGGKTDELDDMGVSGVSLLECFGNVAMNRTNPSDPDNPQSVKADYAAYDFAAEKITLTGNRPRISSGNSVLSGDSISFSRQTGMLNVDGNCILDVEAAAKNGEKPLNAKVSSDKMEFSYEQNRATASGNVKIEDSRGALFAPELELILSGAPTAAKTTEPDTPDIPGIGGMDFDPGSKTVESIRCFGGVNFFGKDGGEGAAETVNYNVNDGAITLAGKTRPWVKQGGNRLEGGTISLAQESGRLVVKDNAEIWLAGANGQTKATSDTLEFDYEAGTGVMLGNVKISDGEAKVECDKMNVYLKDKTGAAKDVKLTAGLENRDFNKLPDRVVCSGNVRGSDPKGALECETLTVNFAENADGGLAVNRIDFNGGVKAAASDFSMIEQSVPGAAEAKPASKSGKPSTMTSDSGFINLAENYAEFNGNVRMVDERVQLSSDKFNAYFIDRTPEVIAAENSPVTVEPESPELAFEPKFESQVPRHIKIGEDKSLTRLLFTGNVKLNGVDDDGNVFSAKGENGSYTVADRMVRMTEENGVKPLLSSNGTVVECEAVEVDLSGDMPLPSGRNQRIISFSPDWGE